MPVSLAMSQNLPIKKIVLQTSDAWGDRLMNFYSAQYRFLYSNIQKILSSSILSLESGYEIAILSEARIAMTFSTAHPAHLNSTHKANLLSLLTRRLEVAKARQDQPLVAALVKRSVIGTRFTLSKWLMPMASLAGTPTTLRPVSQFSPSLKLKCTDGLRKAIGEDSR